MSYPRHTTLTVRAERDYEAAFHEFKPDKRLRWLQQIGTVVVKLELEDRTLDLRLSPVEATIVELFEGQGKATFWSC